VFAIGPADKALTIGGDTVDHGNSGQTHEGANYATARSQRDVHDKKGAKLGCKQKKIITKSSAGVAGNTNNEYDRRRKDADAEKKGWLADEKDWGPVPRQQEHSGRRFVSAGVGRRKC